MSDLSSKQVLSDTWNTVFIKMDAISIMGRGGQPVYQLSMIVLADRVEVGLMLCCHLSVHQICSDALNCSLGSAVGVFASPHQCTSASRNMQMSRAELLFDSPDWLTVFLNSQMFSQFLSWKMSRFLSNASLHLQLLQQGTVGSRDAVPEMLVGVALPSLL